METLASGRMAMMTTLDGSLGEGGGQVLRTALAMSLATGRPFRIERIRAKRIRPGLLRQHLTAVQAAVAVGRADVEGAAIESTDLTFTPRGITPGAYRFAVGSAGSATLVLQTVLPVLLTASAPSELTLEGGTHNPAAPPFDFLDRAFLPLVRAMGVGVDTTLERHGFYPAGGGRFHVQVRPCARLEPLELLTRGAIVRRQATALLSNLPEHIGRRELERVRARLGWVESALAIEQLKNLPGPGNVLMLEVSSEHVTEIFSAFGQHGVTAEHVASQAIDEVRGYLASGAPVGAHLADQLLVPMALGRGGMFRATGLSNHARTNIDVIRQFMDIAIDVERAPEGGVIVRMERGWQS